MEDQARLELEGASGAAELGEDEIGRDFADESLQGLRYGVPRKYNKGDGDGPPEKQEGKQEEKANVNVKTTKDAIDWLKKRATDDVALGMPQKKASRRGSDAIEPGIALGCWELGFRPPVYANGHSCCAPQLTAARIIGNDVMNDPAKQSYILWLGLYMIANDASLRWEAIADVVRDCPSIASQLGAKVASELPHVFAALWQSLAMTDLVTWSNSSQMSTTDAKETSVNLASAVHQCGSDVVENLQALLHLVCLWSTSGMLLDTQTVSEEEVDAEGERKAIAYFVECLESGQAHAPDKSFDAKKVGPSKAVDLDAARGRYVKRQVFDATVGTVAAMMGILDNSLPEDEGTVVFSDKDEQTWSLSWILNLALMDTPRPKGLNNALAVFANAVRVSIKEHDVFFTTTYSDPLEVMTPGWAQAMIALRVLQHAVLKKLDVAAKIQQALGLDELPTPEATLVVASVWLGAQPDMLTRDRMERKRGSKLDADEARSLPCAFAKMMEPQYGRILGPVAPMTGYQDDVLHVMWRSALCTDEETGMEAMDLVMGLSSLSKSGGSDAAGAGVLSRRRALPVAASAIAMLFPGPCAAGMLQHMKGEGVAIASCFSAVPKVTQPMLYALFEKTSAWEWMMRYGDLDPTVVLAPLYLEHFSKAFGFANDGGLSDVTTSVLRRMGWPAQDNAYLKKQQVPPETVDVLDERVFRFFKMVERAVEHHVTRPMLRIAAQAGNAWRELMLTPVAVGLPSEASRASVERVMQSIGPNFSKTRATEFRKDHSVMPATYQQWIEMISTASLSPGHETSARAAELFCEVAAQVQLLHHLVAHRQPLVRGPEHLRSEDEDSQLYERIDNDHASIDAAQNQRLLLGAQAANAMTASISRLLRRAELADITKFRHLFFVALHLTRSKVTPVQLYARCVSKDSAMLVHASCRKKEIVDWSDFLAVSSYESCKAMSETTPYPPERPLAVQMSSAMTDAISDAFLRRSRLSCAGLESPNDDRHLRKLQEALESASSSAEAQKDFSKEVAEAQVEAQERADALQSEERMTPEVTTDAEKIKSLIMLGQGPYCLRLPCMDEVTQMIVDYINGRKQQSELENATTTIVMLEEADCVATCFFNKLYSVPYAKDDYMRLYPEKRG